MTTRHQEGQENGAPPHGGGQLTTEDVIKLHIPQGVPIQRIALQVGEAIGYFNKISSADEHVWRAFKEILMMYQRGNKNFNEVHQEVGLLFANHNNLLSKFAELLPLREIFTANGPTSVHLAPDNATTNEFLNRIEDPFRDDQRVNRDVQVEFIYMYRGGVKDSYEVFEEIKMLFANDHDDLLQGFENFWPRRTTNDVTTATTNGASSATTNGAMMATLQRRMARL